MTNLQEELLWQFGPYQVVRRIDCAGPRLALVNDNQCYVDYPLFAGSDDDRKVYLDWPERWPRYVKSAALVLNDLDRGVIEADLCNVRLTVCLALAFMDHTPEVGPTRWASDMPGYPESYDPETWKHCSTSPAVLNWPLERVWDQYIADLDGEGLHEYAEAARRLDLSALGIDFASSETDEQGLWLRVRVWCDRTEPYQYGYEDVVVIYRPALQESLAQIADEHGPLYHYEIEETFDNLAVVGGPADV